MRRIHVLVEGQTEDGFIGSVMRPHFASLGVMLNPILVDPHPAISTSHPRGGYVTYPKVRKQILRLLYDSSAIAVTTMFDFYALPPTFPGRASAMGTDYLANVCACEEALGADIGHGKFVPYIQLHEYEAFLFVSPFHTEAVLQATGISRDLGRIREQYATPEAIDDGPTTAPSKRIEHLHPAYSKTVHGPLVASRIGLSALRTACPHFNEWVTVLEQICAG